MKSTLQLIATLLPLVLTTGSFAKQSETCSCPSVYRPVCANETITFANECQARCQGFAATQLFVGECFPSNCVCEQIFEPVCANGRQYGNECNAKCAGVTKFTVGKCKETKQCVCPANEYRPVCSGGLTFASRCLAECQGVTELSDGECFSIDNNTTIPTSGNKSNCSESKAKNT